MQYSNEFKMMEDLLLEVTSNPIKVGISMELVSLNGLQLSQNNMDTTIVVNYNWRDMSLKWNPKNYDNLNRVVGNPERIWTPPIEILNVDELANFGLITTFSCTISYDGDVQMSIKQRVKTACSQDPSNYPFDVQQCAIEFSAPGLSSEFLKLDIEKWMIKNGVPGKQLKEKKILGFAETKMEALKNTFFDDNEAWQILGYKVENEDVKGSDNKDYSKLKVTFAIARTTTWYELTLIIPMIGLCFLVVFGIFMPAASGEVIGFQITVLLTLVVYLDILSSNVPKFQDLSKSPKMLVMFMILALASIVAHIVITYNIWCNNKDNDRLYSFGIFKAKVAYYLAKFFDYLTPGKYVIPSVVEDLAKNGRINCCGCENDDDDQENNMRENDPAQREKAEAEKEANYREAWRFYGKMFSHFWGSVISLAILIAISVLFAQMISTAAEAKELF